MGKSRLLSLLIYLLLKLISLPPLVVSISYCNGPCARGTTPSLQSGGCEPSGTLTCEGCEPSDKFEMCQNGIPYTTYECSPPVMSSTSTSAILTHNSFIAGGDGGGPPECTEAYLSNDDPIVALSTGWFKGESGNNLCDKKIRIQASSNGWSVVATVVDQCDSFNACDEVHAGQQPCKNNIVDGSDAVWDKLGLDTEVGEEDITWSMA